MPRSPTFGHVTFAHSILNFRLAQARPLSVESLRYQARGHSSSAHYPCTQQMFVSHYSGAHHFHSTGALPFLLPQLSIPPGFHPQSTCFCSLLRAPVHTCTPFPCFRPPPSPTFPPCSIPSCEHQRRRGGIAGYKPPGVGHTPALVLCFSLELVRQRYLV